MAEKKKTQIVAGDPADIEPTAEGAVADIAVAGAGELAAAAEEMAEAAVDEIGEVEETAEAAVDEIGEVEETSAVQETVIAEVESPAGPELVAVSETVSDVVDVAAETLPDGSEFETAAEVVVDDTVALVEEPTGEVVATETVTVTEGTTTELVDATELETVATETESITVVEAPAAETMADLLAASAVSSEEAAAAAGERPVRDADSVAEEARKAARRGRPRLKLDELEVGTSVRGRVVGLAEFGAFVDIGAMTDGLVHVTELGQRRVRKPEEVLKQGDMVDVWVKEIDLENGRVALSMRSRNLRALDSLEPGETLEGTVTSLTQYGAFVDIGADTEGLLHVSELSSKRVGKPEDVVSVGDKVAVWVKEVDVANGRVSLSMRPQDLRPIDTLTRGETLEGTITSLTKYGAFVDFGAETEGLVHVSEMADHRVNRPEDVVKVGDTVQVWVKEVDVAAHRISLSMRTRPTRPMAEMRPGDVMDGTVSKVMEYGLFVNVGAESEGLVHVSEMGSGFVKSPKDLVRIGDVVEVRVKEVDLARKRISLTMAGLRTDVGGEISADAMAAEDFQDYEPEPEERMPTVVELALRRALGQDEDETAETTAEAPVEAGSPQAEPAAAPPADGDDLSSVYSRMLAEYRASKPAE